MNLKQKLHYALCSLSLIAPMGCYPNSKLITIPDTITLKGGVSPELKGYTDHCLQDIQKRTDESLERATQNLSALAKESTQTMAEATKETLQQLMDGRFTVNVTSEDIKNALSAGKYTLEHKVDPDTIIGTGSLIALLTSAYQCNYLEKDVDDKNVIAPAVLAGIGLVYLAWKSCQTKTPAHPTITTSATSTTQTA